MNREFDNQKNHLTLVNCHMPGVQVYVKSERQVNPFQAGELFRGEECFDGTFSSWERWQKPSPEPKPDPQLNQVVIESMQYRGPFLCGLHDRLLAKVAEVVPVGKTPLLIGILRAGLFVSVGLSRRMAQLGQGLAPVAAIGLFHEAGFDQQALNLALKDYPGAFPVFVDGWTGRGVVANELRRAYAAWNNKPEGLPETPVLATLVDPGHHGDLWGTDRDALVECAHFSAPEVLGFSRAFITDPDAVWSAYRYPEAYRNQGLIKAWLNVFESAPVFEEHGAAAPQKLPELLEEIADLTGTEPSQWKVNVNEVVRTFVNRQPKQVLLGITKGEAEEGLPSLLDLAQKNAVPVNYTPRLGNNYNFLAAVRVK